MPSLKQMMIPTALTLLLLAPFVGASAAHPHPHIYVGTGVHNVILNTKVEDFKVKFHFESAVVGACADVSPVLARFFPPEPVRDGDTDVGVGGGCFAFNTTYGDDTGSTLTVGVQENVQGIRPVWIACVDVNGDGVCDKDNDEYNLCARTASGDVSLVTGGACTVYANPAATLNPAVFVLIIGGLEADRDAITPYAGGSGFIFIN